MPPKKKPIHIHYKSLESAMTAKTDLMGRGWDVRGVFTENAWGDDTTVIYRLEAVPPDPKRVHKHT